MRIFYFECPNVSQLCINDSLTITMAQLLIARTVMSFHYYSCRYLPPLPSTHVWSEANNEEEMKNSKTIKTFAIEPFLSLTSTFNFREI